MPVEFDAASYTATEDCSWELLDRLGMSWNEPARRGYGNAAGLHHPRPGDGQIRDFTLPLRRPNPGPDRGM